MTDIKAIDEEQVVRIVDYAQLKFSEADRIDLARYLTGVQGFAKELAEVDTDGIEPTVSVLNTKNVWRDDEVRPWLGQQQALAQAKNTEAGCFKVPRIMADEEGV